MRTTYRVQEYRWVETADPQIEVIDTFDTLAEAEICFNNFEIQTVGFSLQIEKFTFDEDDNLIDTETVLDSGEYQGEEITGAIVIQWSYEKYVGYARNLKAIGIAGEYPFHNLKYESDLITGNEESTFRPNLSVLFSPEKAKEVTEEEIYDELGSGWKWNHFKNNPNSEYIQEEISNIVKQSV